MNSPEVLAHRGELARENTLAGLRAGLDGGLHGAEIDVQLAKDGTVFLFHDDELDRLAGRRGVARSLDWSELGKVLLSCGEPMCRLSDVLEAWPTGKTLNIELKAGGARLVDRVLELISGRTDIVLSSFDPIMLERTRHCSHERALLLAVDSPPWLHVEGVKALACTTVHLEAVLCTGATLAHYRNTQVNVGIWGATSPQHEVDLASAGVFRVITDTIRDHPLLAGRGSGP